jgi:hypothetical protein
MIAETSMLMETLRGRNDKAATVMPYAVGPASILGELNVLAETGVAHASPIDG